MMATAQAEHIARSCISGAAHSKCVCNSSASGLQEIRKLIISAILATDMSFHFSLTTEFKNHAGLLCTCCSDVYTDSWQRLCD